MRRILVLRHGIVINRFFMMPMQRYFSRRGFEVYNRGYRSTRKGIREHAEDLAGELNVLAEGLEKDGRPWEMFFITQSLAGLVLRYALTHFTMPPVKRAVLMVPPNQGSQTARHYKNFPPYRWVFGTHAGSELAQEPPGIFAECGVPENCEIGVIAGDVRSSRRGARLEKPNDGVVTVEEAKLPPFPLRVLPYGHTSILWVRYAWEEAEHFLQNGSFREGSAGGRDGGA